MKQQVPQPFLGGSLRASQGRVKRQRLLKVGVLVFAAILVLTAVLIGAPQFQIWNPRVDPMLDRSGRNSQIHADAIMVLAYRDDRQVAGRELAKAGVSDNLVVSVSQRVKKSQDPSNRLRLPTGAWFEQCDTQYPDYFAWCVEPEPNDTRGEAAAFSALAATQGWNSVVIVTEPSHLWRATRIFERCFPGRVYAWASTPGNSPARYLYRTLYEGVAIYRDKLLPGRC